VRRLIHAVRALPAGDFHLGDPRDAARGEDLGMARKSYGLLAEFKSAEQLLEAARRTREAGYVRIEAYAPFPVEGLVEAVGSYKDRVPLITLIGGVIGGGGGYFLQWYSAVIDYPLNL